MPMTELPFSQACENNKDPIQHVLKRIFANRTKVLEIGSGTGQHCCYFSAALPHLTWQPTDQQQYSEGLKARTALTQNHNLLPVKILDVRDRPWPSITFDAVFSANTVHIMAWESAKIMLEEIARQLPQGGLFALYGPFNYHGQYTSESNARFDEWLKNQNPESAIRAFEDIDSFLQQRNLSLLEDIEMPANNRILVWQKKQDT